VVLGSWALRPSICTPKLSDNAEGKPVDGGSQLRLGLLCGNLTLAEPFKHAIEDCPQPAQGLDAVTPRSFGILEGFSHRGVEVDWLRRRGYAPNVAAEADANALPNVRPINERRKTRFFATIGQDIGDGYDPRPDFSKSPAGTLGVIVSDEIIQPMGHQHWGQFLEEPLGVLAGEPVDDLAVLNRGTSKDGLLRTGG
jgi:hypothetical protein